MSDKYNFSRRGFLKGAAGAAGTAMGTRLAGRDWIQPAYADGTEKSALLCVFLTGGYNALFGSADSFKNKSFGVNDGNIAALGNGLVVDKASLGSLPAYGTSHMASIGVRHGISDHGNAETMDWSDGNRNHAIRLAAAMGGDAAIKIASIGGFPPSAPRPAEGAVSFQQINSMDTTIRALGGGAPDPKIPARNVAAQALIRAQTMSGRTVTANPKAMTTFKDSYDTSILTLQKPVKPFIFDDIAKDYTGKATGNSTAVTDFTSKFIGAELMIRAGANVVTISDGFNWDSHGDTDGSGVRKRFADQVMPGLTTFVNHIGNDPDLKAMNIVVAIFGDFARSLPGSDHQPNLTTTVIGKYVKVGTTGHTDGNVGLPAGTGSTVQMWSYFAAALKVQTDIFGPNPHALVL